MNISLPKLSTCLSFNNQAEQAARFYTSVFPDSKVGNITYYNSGGYQQHQQIEGTVLTVSFNLSGNEFMGLNGGPVFKFNEAISLVIQCANQTEVDYYWEKLCDGGDEGQCGWLKDRFGVSWQVVPVCLHEMLSCGIPAKAAAVTRTFLEMKKLEIAMLEEAFANN